MCVRLRASVCVCVRVWMWTDAYPAACARAPVHPAGERGAVTAGKLIKVSLLLKLYLTADRSETEDSRPAAVGLLRGRLPHMLHHRHPVRGPHAHHRRVLLCVPMLWELRRGDAPEAEEERRLPEGLLHGLAHRHHRLHRVSVPHLPQRHWNAAVLLFH